MEFVSRPRPVVPPTPDGEIAVAAPPDVPQATPTSPLARLLPVAMLVAAVGMMVFYFSSGGGAMRNPMFMFFPVMMLVSVIGTLAYGGRGANHTAELNTDRRDYLRYLDALADDAAATADAQHEALHWCHPSPDTLWTCAGTDRMWERRPADADFGHVRIGIGAQRLATRLVAPAMGPADDADPVTVMALGQLIRSRSLVPDLPITVPLQSFPVVTVDGDLGTTRGLLRAIVCQLAVFHSPEHIRIAAVTDASAADEWDWLKWLPHHQHPHAVDAAGAARMTHAHIADFLAERERSEHDAASRVVLVLDSAPASVPASVLATATARPQLPGSVTVLAVGAVHDVVSDSQLSLRVGADGLSSDGFAGDELFAQPDVLTPDQAARCARALAPFRPADARTDQPHQPGVSLAWSTLIGIGEPARLDPEAVWRPRSTEGAGAQLRVPIGVTDHGVPLELDIKEAAQGGMGPHGLCVGATGSGKSEFLRTLILGMITVHPPEVLNLILVDFKGGATFLGLEHAPHVSALITNLADDAHLVARMNDALAGEMNRRQEVLRAAGNFASVADYLRARSNNTALSPLPALMIVVDEFSELLQQHPDFAELFVAIGRLGRSLGMHLLLASQRLDEGRLRGLDTHLSYRICLKTFTANESRVVLGVSDAYDLPGTPGAAYLKTAAGELVRFQTAYVSGTETRSESGHSAASATVAEPQLFTAAAVGAVNHPPGGCTERSSLGVHTMLDTVVDRITGHGSLARQIWLPPLSESPPLDMVLAPTPTDGGAALTVPIGLIDCPYEQRRDPLIAALAGASGNVAIVGGPRSGKSTALRTLVLALAATHRPADVQIYCLDFGGGALSSVGSLPHVGSVAARADQDLVRRTVAELESVVRHREAQFRGLGMDSIAEFRRLRACGDPAVAEDPFGDVFLVIDGWATIRQEFDTVEAPITALAARGLAFGVHVVVTASRWAELRPGFKEQLGTRIELRLGDPAESETDRKRARLLTDSPPGRGLTRDGRELVVALPRLDGESTATGLADAIAGAAEHLHAMYHPHNAGDTAGHTAPPIRLLPTKAHRNELTVPAETVSSTQVMIGLGERELQQVALDFGEQPNLVILGDSECGKTATLRMLCQEVVRANTAASAQLMIVDFRRSLLGVVESDHLIGYAISTTALTAQLPALLERLQARMPGDQVTQQQLRTRSWWSGPEIYLIVDDYDLVAGAVSNPLAALVEYLPHAKDLGLHIVVSRRSGGATRAMFDPLLAGLRDLGCMGLMMSASPEEGVLLGSVRPTAMPAGRGTLITRAQPAQLIQVAWSDPP